MDITVKMTPEEYDYFRQYQHKKDFFERRFKEETEKFHKKHEELCSLIVRGLDVEIGEEKTAAIIQDNTATLEALRIAEEWYT